MDFNTIIILRNAEPFWSKEKNPSSETKLFLLALINDGYFVNEVKSLRKKYNIPPNGYPLFDMAKHTKVLNDEQGGLAFTFSASPPSVEPMYIREKMEKDLYKLAKHYSLPETFAWRLFHLISYNSFVNFTNRDAFGIGIAFGEEIIKKVRHAETNIGAIILTHKHSKNELISYIKRRWDYIDKSVMSNLPQTPEAGKRSVSIDIAIETYDLEKQGKTIKEITELLANKYPEDERIYEQWVSKTLRTIKKQISIKSPN